jgi:hypothetical protein
MRPIKESAGFIPPHGNFRELLSYQKAEVVYDITFHFCHKFLTMGDRTIDQMIQAARSGKQNISEGSEASGLDRQLRRLEQDFLKEGGLRERMTRARLQSRQRQ